MTVAATKRYALGLCGVAGLLAAVTSIALIAAIFNTPDHVASAMGRGDVQALFDLVTDRFVAAVRVIARYL
ncbi:MAG TPA: hypothetical protein VJ691_06890 [Vicinamibacterales bacterium]|nr:hypothetical protein [Vicinamibacterales bacterium]